MKKKKKDNWYDFNNISSLMFIKAKKVEIIVPHSTINYSWNKIISTNDHFKL